MAEPLASTWADRELPILRATLARFDSGDDFPELEDVRRNAGIDDVKQFRVALHALEDAGYMDVLFTGGWTADKANGNVERVHERTRRELGSWPAPDSVVERLVEALHAAAEAAAPQDRGKLRAAAEGIAGVGRDLAVAVVAAQIGGR